MYTSKHTYMSKLHSAYSASTVLIGGNSKGDVLFMVYFSIQYIYVIEMRVFLESKHFEILNLGCVFFFMPLIQISKKIALNWQLRKHLMNLKKLEC